MQNMILPLKPDPESCNASSRSFDRSLHAALARLTGGLSPAALSLAYVDWLQHLAASPDKQLALGEEAFANWLRFIALDGAVGQVVAAHAAADDKRFAGEAWQQWPFNAFAAGFLLTQRWWKTATTDISGVSQHHQAVVSFLAHQLLDVVSPSNFVLTNPELLKTTCLQGGLNLVNGTLNLIEDQRRALFGEKPVGTERFAVGRSIAVTPGKVVARNRVMELIQYAPIQPKVHAEPILIVPAWIMKYYILDLSPENSLIKYLVERGHTVFAISWKNPGSEDRDLDFEDYHNLGFRAALDAVSAIVPGPRVHGVGYCLGGTLLAVAAAAMARDGDSRLASATLFAAQTDFTEAGELMLFIDEAQVSFLDDMMAEQGYLDAKQMSGAFQLLRSNDLIWSRILREYLMGERQPMMDLMAWNADATRMPHRMHATYLRRLFLNNELAEGHFTIGGRPVSLRDIRVPIFAVSTLSDHVAPWRSVYKIHRLVRGDVTFVLTSGGHNAGIVSEPGHRGRRFRTKLTRVTDTYTDPDAFIKSTAPADGSWWVAWEAWLAQQSRGDTAPPRIGAQGYDAFVGTFITHYSHTLDR
jgi:polyhydroxyalkanoate synthase